jgi:hypothetical protein
MQQHEDTLTPAPAPAPSLPPLHACDVCGAPSALRCARCQDVYYCGRAHQAAAWRAHRLDCLPPETRAQQAELTRGVKALLAEHGEAAEGLEAWTYDEDRDGSAAPPPPAAEEAAAAAAGSAGGGAVQLTEQQAAAKALLERVIGRGLEDGGDGAPPP